MGVSKLPGVLDHSLADVLMPTQLDMGIWNTEPLQELGLWDAGLRGPPRPTCAERTSSQASWNTAASLAEFSCHT